MTASKRPRRAATSASVIFLRQGGQLFFGDHPVLCLGRGVDYAQRQVEQVADLAVTGQEGLFGRGLAGYAELGPPRWGLAGRTTTWSLPLGAKAGRPGPATTMPPRRPALLAPGAAPVALATRASRCSATPEESMTSVQNTDGLVADI